MLLCHFVSHSQLTSVLTPCLRIIGVPPPGMKFRRTYARTRFGLNSDLSCFIAPLARLIRCHKKRCILWPFILVSEFVFTCKYHYVTGSQGHVRAATLFIYLNCYYLFGCLFVFCNRLFCCCCFFNIYYVLLHLCHLLSHTQSFSVLTHVNEHASG